MDGLKIKQIDPGSYRHLTWNSMTRTFALSEDECGSLQARIGPIEIGAPNAELANARPSQPHLLLQGWAAEQHVLTDGRRQIFRFILPGDIFGFDAKFQLPASTMTAITSVVHAPILFVAADEESDGLTQLFTKIGHTLLAESIKGLQAHVVRLGCLTAYERMAHLFLDLYFRLERVGLAENRAFEMPLPQEVLADALGLSTVHTNRVLQKLRSDGLIETKRNLYALPNLQKLAQVADYGAPPYPVRASASQPLVTAAAHR
jgi:CRP-like cAMP-binding protein